MASDLQSGVATHMKIFSCSQCDQLVFFENVRCMSCDATLAFLPDLAVVSALEPDGEVFKALVPGAKGKARKSVV